MKQSAKFGLPVIILATLLLTGCASQTSTPETAQEAPAEQFTFDEKEFDFGVLKQSSGIATHDFTFTYEGEEPITITGAVGSCACTKGSVNVNKLEKGDTGILTLEFDPNLHEEPKGRFFKTVALPTEPKLNELPEVKMWTEIDLDLGPEAYKLQGPHDDEDDDHHADEEAHAGGQEYHVLKAIELQQMLNDKDFFLLDVHVPEQAHIPGTDAFIDYRTLAENTNQLPNDKNSKIVVYCRSGGMSRSAVNDLAELGFTNVYDLEGGINAFNAL